MHHNVQRVRRARSHYRVQRFNESYGLWQIIFVHREEIEFFCLSKELAFAAGKDEFDPDTANRRSPETYVGYHRAEHFASTEAIAQDSKLVYTPQPRLSLNQWALGGSWKVGAESAVLQTAPGKIVFRFHARDLHLV